MYNFLLQIFFFGALVTIVYLMARGLPRLADGGEEISLLRQVEKWLKRLPVGKADRFINLRLEKGLRKVRVVILRLDNAINRYLAGKRNSGQAAESSERSADLFKQLKKDD